MNKLITALSFTFLLASCASGPTGQKEINIYDPLVLKEILVEGKTTQREVLEKLGAPDMTTEDESKKDTWVYSKSKYQSGSTGISVGALAFLPGPLSLLGGVLDNDKYESSTQSMTLQLQFDRQKRLQRYLLTKSKI